MSGGAIREYLLFSQIPNARREQVLGILAGITGNQPTAFTQQVVIYAQLTAPDTTASKKTKPTVAQPLSYHKLVRDYDVQDDSAVNIQPWAFRAEAVPEPGLTAHISRSVMEHSATEVDLARLKSPAYKLKRQYLQSGYFFVNNNVVIRVLRLHGSLQSDLTEDPTDLPPPNPSNHKLIDASGSWMIEAYVKVGDPANASLCEQAVKELAAFRSTTEGSLDFIVPNRFSLDTRVKNAAG